MKQSAKGLKRLALMSVVGGTLLLCSSIPIKLLIAAHQAPQPEAILVLGGGTGREEAAAQLAKRYPELEVWVSSGDKPPQAASVLFQTTGIATERVHLDYRATDTVTNFTTLVGQFKQRQIQHLYLVTSDFHMTRATVIATIVLGHHGIAFTPIVVPTNRSEESWLRIARDGGRSILWLLTGRTGEQFGLMVQEKLSVYQK